MSGEVRLIWTVDTGRLDIGGPVFLTRGKGHARTRCAFGRALCQRHWHHPGQYRLWVQILSRRWEHAHADQENSCCWTTSKAHCETRRVTVLACVHDSTVTAR
jgi:hypothetical protein